MNNGGGFPGGSVIKKKKNLPAKQRTWVQSLGWEYYTLVFLPEEFHGQRRLACYSPWGCKE